MIKLIKIYVNETFSHEQCFHFNLRMLIKNSFKANNNVCLIFKTIEKDKFL